MNFSIAHRPRILQRYAVKLTLALSVSLCGIALALAVDLPTFQQGKWDFRRSVMVGAQKQPAVQSIQKCINPTDDIRSKWEALARQTCKFSPVRHADNKYQYSAICTKNGVSMHTMSVITVQGPTAYEVVTRSTTGERLSAETLSAHRVGDCSEPATQATTQPTSAH